MSKPLGEGDAPGNWSFEAGPENLNDVRNCVLEPVMRVPRPCEDLFFKIGADVHSCCNVVWDQFPPKFPGYLEPLWVRQGRSSATCNMAAIQGELPNSFVFSAAIWERSHLRFDQGWTSTHSGKPGIWNNIACSARTPDSLAALTLTPQEPTPSSDHRPWRVVKTVRSLSTKFEEID